MTQLKMSITHHPQLDVKTKTTFICWSDIALTSEPRNWRNENRRFPRSRKSTLRRSMEETQDPDSIGAFAVQCERCLKWRLVPTREEYETIRESFIEEPWYCERRPGVACDDPADLEYDTSRLWVADKPNIPKPPPGTLRRLSLRRDCSKLDARYVMPNGKKVRSSGEVERFLDAYPEFKGKFSASNFSFTVPKILEDMVPRNSEGKTPRNKMLKAAEDDED